MTTSRTYLLHEDRRDQLDALTGAVADGDVEGLLRDVLLVPVGNISDHDRRSRDIVEFAALDAAVLRTCLEVERRAPEVPKGAAVEQHLAYTALDHHPPPPSQPAPPIWAAGEDLREVGAVLAVRARQSDRRIQGPSY